MATIAEAPRLDHVSVVGGPRALGEIGFSVTRTEDAPHHGRILLDRSYLEVTSTGDEGGALGSRGWFLRPEDLAADAEALRAAGFTVSGPAPYWGEDGDWLDVIASSPGTCLPTLTRRLDKSEDEWPPPIDAPHPNGACRLSGIRLRLRNPDPVLGFLAAVRIPQDDPTLLPLPEGTRIEIEMTPMGTDGVVAILLERDDGTEFELPVEPQDI